MELLCAALGRPQDRFRSLHVVGTNGKTSVTQMCAALLGAGGVRAGACVSPHVWRWSERVRIGGKEIEPGAFAAAVERVAAAVERLEAKLGEGERVTQFEAAVAACFVAFAEAGVEVAVVEAGLGGRLDATNVIASEATALTSVGLDHVQWLGETELEIATEKLAVLERGTVLVTGRLSPEVAALAARAAGERGARLIDTGGGLPGALPGAPAPYLGRDAAVAIALAEVVRGPLDHAEAAAELAAMRLPGRAEIIDPGGSEPRLILDAAHNEQGAAALAEALPGLAAGRPVLACLSILADKDAAAFAAALAPALAGAVCTAADPGPAMGRPGARAAPPAGLAELLAARGVEAERRDDPDVALARALELARARSGVALCAGSHYLLRYAWKGRNAPSCSR